jgi:hypothetical protein
MEIDLAGETAFVLKHMGDWPALGRSKLANVPEIDRLLSQWRLVDTPTNRALLLTDLVGQIITERLRNAQSQRQARLWALLKDLYMEGESLGQLAHRLGDSARTLQRHANEGSQLLARELFTRLIVEGRSQDLPVAIGLAPHR